MAVPGSGESCHMDLLFDIGCRAPGPAKEREIDFLGASDFAADHGCWPSCPPLALQLLRGHSPEFTRLDWPVFALGSGLPVGWRGLW